MSKRYPDAKRTMAAGVRKPNAGVIGFRRFRILDKSGAGRLPLYQQNAVENVLEAIAAGRKAFLFDAGHRYGQDVDCVQIFGAVSGALEPQP